jgi:alpha-beta hydrolase superfamily lysophospholipase
VLNGYNILAFDFRAHGESGGQLSSFGDRERFDVLGAVRWARANRPAESRRLFGLGVSMGGAALLAAAAEPTDDARAIDAVAVFSTYDNLSTLADDLTSRYMVAPVGWLARHVGVPLAGAHVGTDLAAFSPAAAADRLAPRPLMVVHGRSDHVIPFETGVRLFDRAPHPKVRMWAGELNAETREYVLRANAKYGPARGPTGQPTFNPPQGPTADHNNVLYDDDAVKAVRMFFEAGRSMS